MKVAYQDEGQTALCRITLPQRFQGWNRMAHGGVVSTLLDEIMAHAVIHFVGQAVTASQENRYHAPTPLGRELVVSGWVDQRRGRLVQTRARLELAAGGLLAEASAKFLLAT
jgi:acyl-coenzyme A thioesterase PaaI-like protein